MDAFLRTFVPEFNKDKKKKKKKKKRDHAPSDFCRQDYFR